MKAMLVFACLVAGICASVMSKQASAVDTRDARFVTNEILETIEAISQQIQDDGLDPFYIEKERYVHELPVPIIFAGYADLEEVLSTGLSNIVVNHLHFSVWHSLLTMEVELPHIDLAARVANADLTVFGETLSVRADGRIDIHRIVVDAEVKVNVGLISGISIASVTSYLKIGQITSNIRLSIQGVNYSPEINEFIGVTGPATLNEFSDEVDELLSIILLDIINTHI